MGNLCSSGVKGEGRFRDDTYLVKDAGAAAVATAAMAKASEQEVDKPLDVIAGKVCKSGKPSLDTACIQSDMILNVLDPENGPAKGMPYQVHYLGPPTPPCEDARVATMRALDKIGAQHDCDPEISSILRLTASMFQAPVALVALFDQKRVYVSGSEGGVIPVGDFPWRWTLCAWSLAYNNPQILVIPDTLQDMRFRENAKVTGYPGVRFYCGTPLIASNGHRLGTLCFADVSPRPGFDAASCSVMNNLSELVVRHLEKDIALKLKQRDNEMLQATYGQLQRTLDCFDHCVVLVDTAEDGWKLLHANAAWAKLTGVERGEAIGRSVRDVFEGLDGLQLPTQELMVAANKCHDFQVSGARLRLRSPLGSGPKGGFVLTFRPAAREALDDSVVPIGIPSFLKVGYSSGSSVISDTASSGAHARAATPGARRFYFMSIDLPGAANRRNSITSAASSSIVTWGSGLLGGPGSDAGASAMLEGLQLGHLLGKGSFGSVYYGTWLGTPVAVKVIDQDLTKLPAAGPGMAAPEAVLGQSLRHPNIVATLKYVARRVDRPNPSIAITSGKAEGGTMGHSAAKGGCGVDAAADAADADAADSGVGHAMAAASKGSNVLCTDGAASSEAAWPVINFGTGGAMLEHEGTLGTLSTGGGDWGARPSSAVTAHSSAAQAVAAAKHSAATGGASTPSNILATEEFGSGIDNGRASVQTWILLEYCDKGCLQEAIDRGWLRTERSALTGGPNMRAVLATAREVASALAYLHAHNVVHGDLSGWNVMLCASGAASSEGSRGFVAKVADFGMSRTLEIRSKVQSCTYGTVTHMPPETVVKGTISKAVDVYSFGVLLWQMYTGSRPWAGLRHSQIIMMITSGEAKLVFPPGTPPEYEALTMQCMSPDPDARPSFDDIIKRLEDIRC